MDKRTGEVIERPAWRYTAPDGRSMTPSPGWNYNPGGAAYQPALDRYDFDLARQYVEGSLTGPAFARARAKRDARVAELRTTTPGIVDAAVLAILRAETDPRLY